MERARQGIDSLRMHRFSRLFQGGQIKNTYAIRKVLHQILNHQIPDLELCVEPFGKGLLLDGDPLLLFGVGHLVCEGGGSGDLDEDVQFSAVGRGGACVGVLAQLLPPSAFGGSFAEEVVLFGRSGWQRG